MAWGSHDQEGGIDDLAQIGGPSGSGNVIDPRPSEPNLYLATSHRQSERQTLMTDRPPPRPKRRQKQSRPRPPTGRNQPFHRRKSPSRWNEAINICDATALEALLDPDVVQTIAFQEDETTMTGSAAVIAAYEQPWADGCPGPGSDFEVVSVEGNIVTTAETAELPDGTMIRPSQVFEVSDDGMVVAIQWLEGPVVTEDG